ncbi:MAG: S1C family serine protease [Gammaproteobacteria bacterium]|nr:S1C family serine protease [Gammaproteobacteria bacterium]
MNIFKKITISILAVIACFTLTSCETKTTKTEEAVATNVYEEAVKNGFTGSLDEYLLSLLKSSSYENVYDLAKENGLFDGTLEEFIASLKGEAGSTNIEEVAQNALTSTASITAAFTVTVRDMFGRSYTQQAKSAGSGVIYQIDSNTAYIVTNYHVIYYNGANSPVSDSIYVYLYGMEYDQYGLKATFIGGSMLYDIAVLKVESNIFSDSSYPYHAVTLGNNDELNVGETILAVGNPEGSGLSVTNGIVSVKEETISMYLADRSTVTDRRVIRIDAAVNGGNSGGGLYNEKGELVGIVDAKIVDEDIEGMCYAIPINVAREVANKVIATCNGTSTTSIRRVYLNVTTAIASSKPVYDTATKTLSIVQEITVSKVERGAAYDVLQVGDLIVNIEYNGETYPINSEYDLENVLFKINKGDSINVYIKRGTSYQTVTITFTEDQAIS